uniref:AcidPPc domain-containing protein n=1 Tax=Syphacia muris TaxID=451379 RepID=A0A0N5AB89_9BILA
MEKLKLKKNTVLQIIGIELCTWLLSRNSSNAEIYTIGNCRVHRLIVLLYYFLGFFIIGSIINRIICDVAKYTTGQLRPNFISVCHPDINFSDCKGTNHYIEVYNCTNADERQVFDVHLSFCSGHTAYSFYTATYFYFYLQNRLRNRYTSGAFLPLIQCGVFMLAIYIACTRLSDHKHHFSNVCFGGTLGFIIGYIVAVHFARLPKYRCYDEDSVRKDPCSTQSINQESNESVSTNVKFMRCRDDQTDDNCRGFENVGSSR